MARDSGGPPAPDRSAVALNDALSMCETMETAWATFTGTLNQFGVEHALYGFMATLPRRSVTTEVLSWSSHDEAFTDAYMALGYPDHDWSVEWAMTQTEAQKWYRPEVLEALDHRQKKTEELAYDFGLYEGLVVPIRGISSLSWGGVGLAAPSLSGQEWDRLLNTHQETIETLVQTFHEFVLSRGYLDHFELSERELEVLKWLVCGFNKHDIADRLTISPRTAEVHIYRIRQKLRCVNDAQVTAKALVFNLLDA